MIEDLSRSGQCEVSVDESAWTTVYRLLSHSKRCALLDALSRSEEPLPLADAAEEVVRLNNDSPLGDIDQSTVKKCSISLHHRHVPVLADGGFVTVEADETLSLTEKGVQLHEIQQQLKHDSSEYL